MPRPTTIAAAALVALAAAAGCGDDDSPPEVIGTTIADAEAVTVIGTDFAFEPSTIELTAGEPVNITFQVDDGGHDFAVNAVGFRIPILDEGEAAVATLQIEEPGTYELVCLVPGHIDEGMVGSIVVS